MTRFSAPEMQIGSTILRGYRRLNLLTNPSFEVDTSNWGVVSGYNATLSRNTTQTANNVTSAACLAYTLTANDGGGWLYYTPTLSASAGVVFTGSIYVRPTTSGRSARVELAWAAGGVVNTNTTYTPLTANTWTRVSFTQAAPSNATGVTMAVRIQGGTTGETYYFDLAMLEQGNLGDYFDGYYDGRRFTGTQHLSTSETAAFYAYGMPIVNVGTPLSPTDGATKLYVDSSLSGSYRARFIVPNPGTASIPFTGIPSAAAIVRVTYALRNQSTGTTLTTGIQVNNTGSGYRQALTGSSNGAAYNNVISGSGYAIVGRHPGADATAGVWGSGTVTFTSWDQAHSGSLQWTCTSNYCDTTANNASTYGGGQCSFGGPYGSLTVMPSTGQFSPGSEVVVEAVTAP